MNMETFLFNLITVFLISVALLWAYWAAFYPAIILKARFRIATIQDEVRLATLENHELLITRSYLEFEHFLAIANRVIHHHDIVGLYLRHPQAHEIESIGRRIRVVMEEPALAAQFQELTRWMMAVRMVSAPTYLFIDVVLVSLSLFSDWARNLTRKKEQEAFTVGECLPA
ncbi:MAG: hypothetical protein ABR589_07600 [Chthoniobacterales bacterium]